jgi:hypothetical protein
VISDLAQQFQGAVAGGKRPSLNLEVVEQAFRQAVQDIAGTLPRRFVADSGPAGPVPGTTGLVARRVSEEASALETEFQAALVKGTKQPQFDIEAAIETFRRLERGILGSPMAPLPGSGGSGAMPVRGGAGAAAGVPALPVEQQRPVPGIPGTTRIPTAQPLSAATMRALGRAPWLRDPVGPVAPPDCLPEGRSEARPKRTVVPPASGPSGIEALLGPGGELRVAGDVILDHGYPVRNPSAGRSELFVAPPGSTPGKGIEGLRRAAVARIVAAPPYVIVDTNWLDRFAGGQFPEDTLSDVRDGMPSPFLADQPVSPALADIDRPSAEEFDRRRRGGPASPPAMPRESARPAHSAPEGPGLASGGAAPLPPRGAGRTISGRPGPIGPGMESPGGPLSLPATTRRGAGGDGIAAYLGRCSEAGAAVHAARANLREAANATYATPEERKKAVDQAWGDLDAADTAYVRTTEKVTSNPDMFYRRVQEWEARQKHQEERRTSREKKERNGQAARAARECKERARSARDSATSANARLTQFRRDADPGAVRTARDAVAQAGTAAKAAKKAAQRARRAAQYGSRDEADAAKSAADEAAKAAEKASKDAWLAVLAADPKKVAGDQLVPPPEGGPTAKPPDAPGGDQTAGKGKDEPPKETPPEVKIGDVFVGDSPPGRAQCQVGWCKPDEEECICWWELLTVTGVKGRDIRGLVESSDTLPRLPPDGGLMFQEGPPSPEPRKPPAGAQPPPEMTFADKLRENIAKAAEAAVAHEFPGRLAKVPVKEETDPGRTYWSQVHFVKKSKDGRVEVLDEEEECEAEGKPDCKYDDKDETDAEGWKIHRTHMIFADRWTDKAIEEAYKGGGFRLGCNTAAILMMFKGILDTLIQEARRGFTGDTADDAEAGARDLFRETFKSIRLGGWDDGTHPPVDVVQGSAKRGHFIYMQNDDFAPNKEDLRGEAMILLTDEPARGFKKEDYEKTKVYAHGFEIPTSLGRVYTTLEGARNPQSTVEPKLAREGFYELEKGFVATLERSVSKLRGELGADSGQTPK